MNKKKETVSKYLSFILRHNPQSIGVDMDAAGWVRIDELVAKAKIALTRERIEDEVRKSDKQRFAISEDGARIRANQGHSVDVDLGLEPKTPPETLFHGTATRFVESIRATGLQPRGRRHVHLSTDKKTATAVGRRYGAPIILEIPAAKLSAAGQAFYVSENGVWLTGEIAPEWLVFPGDA